MKRKLLLAGLFVGGLILVLIWMQGGFHSKAPGGETPIPEKKEGALRTVKVETSHSTGQVSVSGTVVSRETASIASRSGGYVIEINAEAGDRVKKEQVLLRIDSKELAEREAQAKAGLESAEADLVKADRDFERFKYLYEKEAVAKKELDDATARYEIAKAARQRAKAALEEAATMLSYTVVTAPFGGVIAERNVNVGDLVTPGRPLFSIYMPGTAEMVAAAGEQYAPYLKEGTSVTVKIPSIDLQQDSKIREVVPQRDVKSRTVTVKAPIAETPGLGPGLYGTMTFNTLTSEVIMIPYSAVKVVGQLETVRVLEGGVVRVRHVKAGRRVNGKVEILSGLNEGDEVVID